MSIEPRNGKYRVRYPGFQSRTFTRKADADAYELDCRRRVQLGHLYRERPHTLGVELKGFLDRLAATGDLRPRGQEFYDAAYKALAPLHDVMLPNLNRPLVEDFLAGRAKQYPVAAERDRQLLVRALKAAKDRGQRIDESVLSIPAIRHTPRRGKALTARQLYEFAAWFPDDQRNLILLAGMVGARQHFWFQLTPDMLDLSRGTMDAPADMQKNRKNHRVHLTDLETGLFREQLKRSLHSKLVFPGPNGGQWDKDNFRNRVWEPSVKLARKDNPVYTGFTFHLLRHTAGSLMALSGMDCAVAAERIGHTDGGALFLKTYRHLYAGEKERHAKLFEAFLAAELKDENAEEAAL